MKYLLKIKKKPDTACNVSIQITSDLIEFNSLTDLIRHLFDNAIFIDSYEIFKVNEFEENVDDSDVSSSGQVSITGATTQTTFH